MDYKIGILKVREKLIKRMYLYINKYKNMYMYMLYDWSSAIYLQVNYEEYSFKIMGN